MALVPALAVVGNLSTAACAPPPSPSAPEATAIFAQAIADAIAGGASDTQIQILRDAGDAGKLTLEDVKGAVGDTFACFENAGIDHSAIDVITQEGLARVSYNFHGIAGASEEQSLAVADACMFANSYYVEGLYLGQPQSREVTDRFFTDHMRTPLIECLRSAHIEFDDQAPNDEIWLIASKRAAEIAAPYASGDLQGHPTDCVSVPVTGTPSSG